MGVSFPSKLKKKGYCTSVGIVVPCEEKYVYAFCMDDSVTIKFGNTIPSNIQNEANKHSKMITEADLTVYYENVISTDTIFYNRILAFLIRKNKNFFK